jgi:electron transfer flavoprotein alpha/beta subunit
MAAKKKEVRVVTPAALEAQQEIVALSLPVRSKQTQMIDGPPAAAAVELVRRLREEARVL